MRKNTFNLLIGLVVSCSLFGQKLAPGKNYEVAVVGFYNLENLFDTIVDSDVNKILQDDFTPEGDHRFTSERYQEKLENLSRVIGDMAKETTPDGPAVLGICEIENRQVVEDLVAMPSIKDRNYKVVHYDSPDRRGIDVGFIYQEKYFKLESSKQYPLRNPEEPDFYTRDQLLVSGDLNGERMHFIVAHWPSRRGGEKRSRPGRILAAELALHIMDSIREQEPNAKIMFMGDLNDDPLSYSMKKVMESEGDIEKVEANGLYNPMEKFYKLGIGTLAWRDNWNLFDQMVLTSPLVETGSDFSSYKFFKAKVFNEPYLKQTSGSFAGYPLRTYVGTTWQGGFSDHFPVYILLIKEKE